MKNIILFILLLSFMASCSKSSQSETLCDTELICPDEDCLFTLDNSEGFSTFLNCYGQWAISVNSDIDANTWYIVDKWDQEFQEEGLEVKFCGYVRENSLPLLLPDPMPGSFYQIELEGIQTKED